MKNRKILKHIIAFSLLTMVFSCKNSSMKYRFPNTAMEKMREEFKDAHPDFYRGWYDGCEVGVSAGANKFYKMFYKSNQVDGYKIVGSKKYSNAWGSGFWYCYRYQFIKNKSSVWGSITGGYR